MKRSPWVGRLWRPLVLSTLVALPLAPASSCAAAALLADDDIDDNSPSVQNVSRPAPGVKRSRHIRLAPDLLRSADSPFHRPSPRALARPSSRLTINAFPDAALEAIVERTDYQGADRFVAKGTVRNVPGSLALFAANNGSLAATLFVPGKGIYKILPVSDGLHEILEVDPDSIPPCGPELVPHTEPAANQGDSIPDPNPSVPPLPGDPIPPVSGDYNTIDVMVVYTAAARVGAGGTSGIQTLIDLAIAEANTCYQNSSINARLNLVYRGEVAYTETGDANTDLSRLRATSDGQLDTVHALRNQYGADIVSLFTESMATYAGLGYVMSPPSSSFAPYAFNVVRRAYATGQYVFAHEVGHNIGCAHDRQNSSSGGSYSYSYGHRFYAGGTQYRTVMAYAPGARIPYFSNPDVSYNGTATGVASSSPTSADNAKSINNTAPIIANFRGTVTLVSLASSSRTATEDDGSLDFTVTRSGGTNSTVTVQYATANGTATAGSDFTAISGTLTFNPGETTQTLSVSLLDNTSHENTETFQLRLSSPVGAALGTATTTITIQDDDRSTVAMTGASRSTFETNVVLSIPLTRTGNTNSAVSVRYATANSTATSGSDYDALSGTLSFAEGQTEASLSLRIRDDSTSESDEVLYLRLSSPLNTALGTYTNLKVTIRQSDKSILRFSASAVTASEAAGTVAIGVRRDTPTNNVATVRYATANGTALAGTHYTATSGTLAFAPGEISKTISIPITDNNTLNGDKAFTVRLTSPFDGTLGLASTTVTIRDNEVSYVSFTLAKKWVDETSGSVPFAVQRTGNTNNQVSVRYATVNGTALAGSDYTATSGTLTFAAGETNKPVTVTLRTDTAAESSESFYLRLSSPTGTSLGTYTNLEVAIRNSAAPSLAALAGVRALPITNPADFPPTITALTVNADGTPQLEIHGPASVPFVLEASSNLVDWKQIATNEIGESPFLWSDPEIPHPQHRYYRISVPLEVAPR